MHAITVCRLLLVFKKPLPYSFKQADNRVAGVCTGLIATVLGLIAVITMFFNPAYVFPSIGLVFWGLLSFYASLKRLEPLTRQRIVASGVMMLIAVFSFSILMLRVFFLRLIFQAVSQRAYFFPSAPTILFFSSWFTSLISIILLRPVLHRFGVEDGSFKLLVDLLIIGWALVSVFIGIFIVILILIIMLLKMPILLTISSPKQNSL